MEMKYNIDDVTIREFHRIGLQALYVGGFFASTNRLSWTYQHKNNTSPYVMDILRGMTT